MDYFKLKDCLIDLNKIPVVSHDKDSRIEFKNKDTIPITNDAMFKHIFGREENIKFPCKLLSYILDVSYETLIDNLSFSKNETGKKKKQDVNYRQDLVVKLDDIRINIEMNNNSSEVIRERNLSYLLRLREDKKYKRKYTPIIQINLNNYCYKDDLTVRRDYAIMSQDQIIYTNKIIIIDIYLPNIKKKCYTNSELSEMEKFLLIGILEDPKKALEYVGDDIVMGELKRELVVYDLPDDLGESYDKEEALKEQWKEDYTREGSEITLKLLDKNVNLEELAEETDRTVEELEKLRENIYKSKVVYDLPDDLGESYDKEEALKEQYKEDYTREGSEITLKLLDKNVNLEELAEETDRTVEELEKLRENVIGSEEYYALAKKFIKNNIDLNIIADATGISLDELIRIKEEMNN